MIKIGKYIIRHEYDDRTGEYLWMLKDDGECMGYDEDRFEKWLDDFWEKEF